MTSPNTVCSAFGGEPRERRIPHAMSFKPVYLCPGHWPSVSKRLTYGAAMYAAARLSARKDRLGAFCLASECLSCRNLEGDAKAVRKHLLNELTDDGQSIDSNIEEPK